MTDETNNQPPVPGPANDPNAIPANANEGCVGPASQEAGKASACAGCPNRTACASGKGREVDPGEHSISREENFSTTGVECLTRNIFRDNELKFLFHSSASNFESSYSCLDITFLLKSLPAIHDVINVPLPR